MKKFFGLICCLALIAACSSDNGGDPLPPTSGNPDPEPPKDQNNFERGDMLVHWADNIIIPSYEAFDSELNNLVVAFDGFKLDASATNLIALRDAWKSAYRVWQHVSMFEIGPAETLGFRLNMNIYPTDTEKIDGFVASGSYDLSLPSNRAAKGFPALDYLLNGLAADDNAIISKYNGADKGSLINYFEAVLTDMETLTASVIAEWKGDYRNTFVSNSGASATASVDRFVNDFVFYYEKFLRAGKMGIPLGVFSGVQAPNTVEALYFEGFSNELFLEALNAVQDFFNGKHYGSNVVGESLNSYLSELGRQDLGDEIDTQFNSTRTAVNGLDSFSEELQVNPAVSMLSAYDEAQKTVSLLKVDMFSAMSISLDYVDADGD